MKVVNIVVKIMVALVAVAGAVYAIATYGDKMVAWSRNLLSRCKCGSGCSCGCDENCTCGCQDGEPCTCGCQDGEASDCGCQDSEPCCCECAEAVEEAPVVAEEADFEG